MNEETEAVPQQEVTPPAQQTESVQAEQTNETEVTQAAKPVRKRAARPRRPRLEQEGNSLEEPARKRTASRKRVAVDPAAASRQPEEWVPSEAAAISRAENENAASNAEFIPVPPVSDSVSVINPPFELVRPVEEQPETEPESGRISENNFTEQSSENIAPAASADGDYVAPEATVSTDVQQQSDSDSQQDGAGQKQEYSENGGRWSRFQRGHGRNRDRRNRFHRDGEVQQQGQDGQQVPQPPRPQLPPIHLREIEDKPLEEINKMLESFMTPEEIAGVFRKHDVINGFIRAYMRRGGIVITNGVIEITSDGYGFLRSQKASYLPCPEDVYVAPQYVRRFNLRTGDFVEGPIRDPRERPDRGKEKFLALGRIESVNGRPPAEWRRVIPFENLTPLFPNRRINLEVASENISMRILNIFAPIGFGQRGIIVAPPRTGKTVLMQQMANAISANHPDAYLIVLLIDERPEEVTDMQRNTKAHVLSSTFDEAPERHAQVAEMVIEMAKRMVESGKDVIILLDSITRLARAYNTLQPHSGKILSGGVDATSLHKPKRFFGAARNIENGGSLTIIATALIETGSKMDEVIFEEFKGTGNMEVVLDRQISDKRIFPAINIEASGTRKEELLLHPEELNRTWLLRRALNGVPPVESIEMVIKRIKSTKSNAEFLMSIKE